MKTIWVFGATGALALGVVAHGAWRTHADEADKTKQRAELAEVREELSRLAGKRDQAEEARRALQALAGTAARAHVEGSSSGTELEPPAAEAPVTEESEVDPEEEAKAHRLELQDSLEATFTTESYDAGWAHGAQDKAEELVQASLPAGSAVRAIDCRQTLCRVELDHHDLQSHREFVGRFDERMQWGGPAAILFDETVPGKVATIAYLGRNEVPFPENTPL